MEILGCHKSDDEAPVTREQLKAVNEKLDSFLQSSKASSTGYYSQATIKSFLETLTKEHSANLEKMNKAVDLFVYSSFESNTAKTNEVISSLGSTLKTEKEKLEVVCTSLQTDYVEFNSSIISKIIKLQDDLAMERKIMDALAIKTEKVKVLIVKSVFAMINQLEGVPEFGLIPKLRGEDVNQSKKEDPKPSLKTTVKAKSKTEPKGIEKDF
ncbi:unnamed protein product [Lactuca saligna]|uniref:Uncharacterized protein n=1 Tax=Lactuca saligna TaxID=75948 RepID=A0AA35VGA0_LACSI|nr:unnamed protein product [Lactuca saligna]